MRLRTHLPTRVLCSVALLTTGVFGLAEIQKNSAQAVAPVATIDVDRLDDFAVATCTVAPGDCSLRGAMAFADSNPGSTVNVPAGTYTLNGGELSVGSATNTNTTIVGAGASSTIVVASPGSRIFNINPSTADNVTVSISGLTLRGGTAGAFGGGAILAGWTGNVLNVTDVTFDANTAPAPFSGAAISYGGGGNLNVVSSRFTNNVTVAGAGSQGLGSAIFMNMDSNPGNLTVQSSTFTGNSALDQGGAIWLGGSASPTNTFTITGSTFTGNTATGAGQGGAIFLASGVANLHFNRIVGNTGVSGSGLHSLVGSTTSADNNWWGCNAGPGSAGCDTVGNSGGAVQTLSPRLNLTHTATPSTVNVGATSTLTASFLKNSGNANVSSSDLGALIGRSISFGSAVGGTISSPQATIQSNGTATATFNATSPTNSGSASATVDNQTVTASPIVVTAPDLTIAKSHTGSFVQGSSGNTYSVVVTNSGIGEKSAGQSVSVTDIPPSGLTVTAMSGSGWTCTTLPTCSRSDVLAAGASYPAVTVTVDVAANATSPKINQVAVTTAQTESNGGNNTASDSTVILDLPKPDLTVAKSHTGSFAQGSSGNTYSVVVTNSGAGDKSAGQSVNVTDVPPSGLTVTAMSGSGWTCTTLPTCSRSDVLAAGDSYPTVTVTVDVAANATSPKINQVVVSTAATESNGGNNTASDSTVITASAADLTISKSHSGDFLQGSSGNAYSVVVTNSGNAAKLAGQSVSVTDIPPSGLTVTAMSGTGWTCTTLPTCTRSDVLAAGDSYPTLTVTVDVAANATSPKINQVAVTTAQTESNSGNNTASDSTVITPSAPDLTITKSHTGDFLQGSSGNTYSVVVTNSGNAAKLAGQSVSVTDIPPSGLTVTAMSGSGWTCTTLPTCTRSDVLAAGDSYPTVTVTVDVAANATSPRINQVAVTTAQFESNSGNNTASDSTVITTVAPDLTVTKVAQGGPFSQGGTVTYLITVTNGGNGPMTGTITMQDIIPTGLTVTSVTSAPVTCSSAVTSCSGASITSAVTEWSCTNAQPVECVRTIPLPAGASSVITMNANIAANAPASITNTATVSGGGESNTGNNSGTSVISVTAVAPDLTIVKTSSSTFNQGGTATYTLTVANGGNGPTVGSYRVVDTLPTGLTTSALVAVGWNCTASTIGVLDCSNATPIAAGGSAPVITLEVDIAANAPSSITNTAEVSGGGESNTSNNSGSHTASVASTGTIIVRKVTSPAGGTGYGFTSDVPGAASFSLDDGQSRTINAVLPGSYSVTEQTKVGSTLTNLVCTDPTSNTTVNVSSRTASINIVAGETVDCTFTNTQTPAPSAELLYAPSVTPPETIAIGSQYAVETAQRVNVTCAGTVNAVWWYRTASDTGTNTVTVWRGGTAVGSGAGNPGATGWVKLDLTAPLSVSPGDQLLVGVHHPNGAYGYRLNGFTNRSVNSASGCLVAPASAVGAKNGLYKYSPTPAVPDLSYADSEYFISPDFTPGAPPPPPPTGTIFIRKSTSPAGGTGFAFLTNVPGSTSFTLNDGQSQTMSGLTPGTYTVIENSPIGYTLTGLVCTDPTNNTTVNVSTRTAAINVAAGETIDCTFSNTATAPATGTVIIRKVSVPAGGTGFGFTSTIGGAAAFTLNDGQNRTISDVPTGTYAVIEDAPAGGGSTTVSCIDPDSGTTVSSGTRTATVDLDAGETVDCTFTNQASAPAEMLYATSVIPPESIAIGSQYAVETAQRINFTCAGSVSGVWWYRTASDTGNNTVSAWRGSTLVAEKQGNPGATGWVYLAFDAPFGVTAGDQLMVGVHHPNGAYGFRSNGFTGRSVASATGCMTSPASTAGRSERAVQVHADPSPTGPVVSGFGVLHLT